MGCTRRSSMGRVLRPSIGEPLMPSRQSRTKANVDLVGHSLQHQKLNLSWLSPAVTNTPSSCRHSKSPAAHRTLAHMHLMVAKVASRKAHMNMSRVLLD